MVLVTNLPAYTVYSVYHSRGKHAKHALLLEFFCPVATQKTDPEKDHAWAFYLTLNFFIMLRYELKSERDGIDE